MYKSALAVCLISLLQSTSVVHGDSFIIKYSSIQSNSSCGVVSTTNINSLSGYFTDGGNSTSFTVDHIENEKSNLTSVSVNIVASSANAFYIDVNATADNNVLVKNFTVSKNSESYLSGSQQFKRLYLKSSSFSSTSGNMSACIDLGFVFDTPVGNGTGHNVDVINVGCWTWIHNTTFSLSQSEADYNLTGWAEQLNKQICSGSVISVQLTPLFAIVVAAIISIINK